LCYVERKVIWEQKALDEICIKHFCSKRSGPARVYLVTHPEQKFIGGFMDGFLRGQHLLLKISFFTWKFDESFSDVLFCL